MGGDDGCTGAPGAGETRARSAGDMRARMLAGRPYLPVDPRLAAEHARAVRLTRRLGELDPADGAGARAVLTELFAGFGAGSQIRAPLHCDYGYQTTIGARCFANFGLVLLDVAEISVGDDTQIGPYVQLLTATHPLEPRPRRDKWESARPVRVGANVWLGGGAVVCPGVSVGDDAVVAAGAVVTRDVPAAVLVAGVPARVVRPLPGDASPLVP